MLPDGPPRATATTLRWLTRPHALLSECAHRYGNSFTLDLGESGQFVIVSAPDAIRDVFTASPEALHAGEGNAVMRAFLGPRSLLLLEEDAHVRERRFLARAFGGRWIASWHELIERAALSEISGWVEGEELVAQQAMQRISIDVILGAIFGVTAGARRDELRESLLAFLEDPKFNLGLMGTLGDVSPSPTWMRFTAALARIRGMLRELIAMRRADPRRGAPDVLSIMLSCEREDGSTLSDEELEDELLTLSVTGFETTATALAWGLFAIHRRPDVRDAIAAGDEVTLDAACREVLRLHPVIPIVARRARVDLVVGDLTIPEGTIVAPCIYLAHRRPEAWPEPDAFRPERFVDRRPSPWEYLPFGGGVRRCLGMQLALAEMRTTLRTVLSRVTLETIDPEEVRPRRRSVTIAPSSGPRFRVVEISTEKDTHARTG